MGGDERPAGSTGRWAATGDGPEPPTYRTGTARPVYPQSESTGGFPIVPEGSTRAGVAGATPVGGSTGAFGTVSPQGWAEPGRAAQATGQWGQPYGRSQTDAAYPVTAVPSPRPPRWNGAPPGGWGAPPSQSSAGGWVGPQQWGPPQPWTPQLPAPRKRPAGLLALIVVLFLLAPIAGGTAVAFYLNSGNGQPTDVGAGSGQTGRAVPLGPPQVGSSQDVPGANATATGNPLVDGKAIATIVNPSVVDVNTVLGLQNARAAGTGILLNSSGLVLTNNHVIAGATDIKAVSVVTGRTFQASVVGYDRAHDVAVIQLNGASGLSHITLGDSSKVKINDPIVAIGNAGGRGGQPTVVTGSVTGTNQSITATDEDGTNPRRLSGLIQIAADIRAGDSGGPLVDKAAHLIGMDTAAAVDSSGASQGTGYAVPVNTALSIAKQIEAGTTTSTIHIGQTAMLGVSATDAKGNNAGAQISDFIPGGPARQAGLQVGDIIVAVDGHTVTSAADLTDIIDNHHPGDQVRVQLIRNGQNGSTVVTLGVGPAA